MRARKLQPGCRRGIMAPLAGILTVFLVGMVAFAVDLGYVTVTKSELQNAADSAALAGAQPLMDGYVEYYLPGQTNKDKIVEDSLAEARKRAKEYAGYNAAGDKTGLTLSDSDIEFGFRDMTGKFVATPGPIYAVFPNTIRVTTRRDGAANGSLGLFFAPAIGTSSIDLTATAAATIYGGTVSGFNPGKVNSGMMPMTFDYYHWETFFKTGLDPDGGKRVDDDGNPVLLVYPSNFYKGNFGLLSLDDGTINAAQLRSWIHDGVTPSEIQLLQDRNLIPVSVTDPVQFDWNGSPGFKASNVMDVNEHVGQSFVLPLFRPKIATKVLYEAGEGKGSNYNYDIVAFVGVQIAQPNDINREVVVQPAAVIDPNATFSNLQPAGADPTNLQITMFAAPKLTE